MFKNFKKFITGLTLALIFAVTFGNIANAQSDVYLTKKAKNGVYLKYVVVDMNVPNYNLELSYNENFAPTNFTNLINKKNTKDKKAIAAINGTYFQCYEKDTQKGRPWYGLYADGKQLTPGYNGATFAYTNNRRYVVERVAEFKDGERNVTNKMDEKLKKIKGKSVLEIDAGPSLLIDGKITSDGVIEGFREAKVVSAVSQRSFIAGTKNNKLIIGTAVASTKKLAEAVKEIGGYNAICLDGGASSALWHRGKICTPAGRQLSNVLVITRSNKPVDMKKMKTKETGEYESANYVQNQDPESMTDNNVFINNKLYGTDSFTFKPTWGTASTNNITDFVFLSDTGEPCMLYYEVEKTGGKTLYKLNATRRNWKDSMPARYGISSVIQPTMYTDENNQASVYKIYPYIYDYLVKTGNYCIKKSEGSLEEGKNFKKLFKHHLKMPLKAGTYEKKVVDDTVKYLKEEIGFKDVKEAEVVDAINVLRYTMLSYKVYFKITEGYRLYDFCTLGGNYVQNFK